MSKYSKEGYEMMLVRKASAWPYYLAGATWFIYAMIFPLYRWLDFLVAALLCAGTFFIAKRFFRPTDMWVSRKPEKIDTGDAQADAMLSQGGDCLTRLRSARAQIRDLVVRDKLGRIAQTVESILAHVGENPKKAVRIRKFMDYYLPALLKLAQSYAQLEGQDVKGENISAGMEGIKGILDTVEKAFRKQFDALYDDAALDIITDIQVLENMLAGEGLAGGIKNENHQGGNRI